MRVSFPLVIAVLFLLAPWGARAGPDCTAYRDFTDIQGLSFGGVAVDAQGRMLIADPQGDRILRTRSEHSRVVAEWGGPGNGPGEFRDPRFVAVDKDGNVFVADVGNFRIQKFSTHGWFIDAWGYPGEDDGEFMWITGLALDADGMVYVLDARNCNVQKFDNDGSWMETWPLPCATGGGEETGGGGPREDIARASTELVTPRGMTVGPEGDVYVLFPRASRVVQLNIQGNPIRAWGMPGDDPGQFNAPHAIAACPVSGFVYVADTGNSCVQMFTGTGQYVEMWQDIGMRPQAQVRRMHLPPERELIHGRPPVDVPAGIAEPNHLVVGPDGDLHMLDPACGAQMTYAYPTCPVKSVAMVNHQGCERLVTPDGPARTQVVIPGVEGFDFDHADLGRLHLGEVMPASARTGDVSYRAMRTGNCENVSPDGRTDLILEFWKTDLLAASGTEAPGDVGEFTFHGFLDDFTPFWAEGEVNTRTDDATDWTGGGREDIARVGYTLPSAARVTVRVFDVRGRLVETLLTETQPAGDHEVFWAPVGQVSGVYFMRVETADRTLRIRKVAVIR